MAGVVHFTRCFVHVEEAWHAWLSVLGEPVITAESGWPVVHAACDYKQPVRFGNEVAVALDAAVAGESSLAIDFEISKGDPAEPVARGRVVVACVAISPEGKWRTHPVPDDLLAKLSAS